MNGESYNVVFRGIADGSTAQKVKDNLAALFKTSPQKFDVFFHGKPVVVKRGVNRDTAAKYKSAFEKAGARCQIRQSSQGYIPESDTALGLYEDPISCPKCGFHQEKSESCLACGVIFAKIVPQKHPEDKVPEPVDENAPTEGIINKTFDIKRFLGPKSGLISTLLIILFVAFALLEMFYLKGERIAHGSIKIGDEKASLSIAVNKAHEKHFVQVYTRKERTLRLRVLGPEDEVVYNNTELGNHKGYRSFTFRPEKPGTYRLFVDPGILSIGSWGNAKASVYINDRRVLTRFLGWFNF